MLVGCVLLQELDCEYLCDGLSKMFRVWLSYRSYIAELETRTYVVS
jgi:hypothetical protein